MSGSSRTTSDRKFDEFGDINCEDEWARLDNFAVHLQTNRLLKATSSFMVADGCADCYHGAEKQQFAPAA